MEGSHAIGSSWDLNAEEWIEVISDSKIPSRKITCPAIVNHLLSYQLKNILDLGCGEGWLCRALSSQGIITCGVDGAERLILEAKVKDKVSIYQCLRFEDIINGAKIEGAPFEGIVLNFCIYEKEMIEKLLLQTHDILKKNGYIFIQTLHPFTYHKSGQAYKSTWVDDSWKGLPGNFKKPHQWYFRTLEDWINLFQKSEFALVDLKEPKGVEAELPSSIIFTLKKSK